MEGGEGDYLLDEGFSGEGLVDGDDVEEEVLDV